MDWTSAGRTSLEAPFHAAPGVAPCADRRSMGVADGSASRGTAAVDIVLATRENRLTESYSDVVMLTDCFATHFT